MEALGEAQPSGKEAKNNNFISHILYHEKFLTFVTHKQFRVAAPSIHLDYIKDFEMVKDDLKGGDQLKTGSQKVCR